MNPQDAQDTQTGLPVGLPVGSGPEAAQGVAGGNSRVSRGTDTPRFSSSRPTASRPQRIGSRIRARLATDLSARDRGVMEQIWQHRYLTTRQITALVFNGHASEDSAARTARRVLARLHRNQLVRPLARRVGGVRAGSDARIWQLAPAGARIVRPDTGKSWRTHEPSERFLQHTLAVADAHLELRRATQHGMNVEVQIEPLSWRYFTDIGGGSRLVRPDLAAVLLGSDEDGEFEDRWFIEVDMGTESIPSLLSKCHRYRDYYQSGTEQTEHGTFPRVLWLMHGHCAASRIQTLQQRILRSPRLDPRLFHITTPHALSSVVWNDSSQNGHEPGYSNERRNI